MNNVYSTMSRDVSRGDAIRKFALNYNSFPISKVKIRVSKKKLNSRKININAQYFLRLNIVKKVKENRER